MKRLNLLFMIVLAVPLQATPFGGGGMIASDGGIFGEQPRRVNAPAQAQAGNADWVDWMESILMPGDNRYAQDWDTFMNNCGGQGRWGYGYSEEQYQRFREHMNSAYFQSWFAQLQSGERDDWDDFWNALKMLDGLPLGLSDIELLIIIWALIFSAAVYFRIKNTNKKK